MSLSLFSASTASTATPINMYGSPVFLSQFTISTATPLSKQMDHCHLSLSASMDHQSYCPPSVLSHPCQHRWITTVTVTVHCQHRWITSVTVHRQYCHILVNMDGSPLTLSLFTVSIDGSPVLLTTVSTVTSLSTQTDHQCHFHCSLSICYLPIINYHKW